MPPRSLAGFSQRSAAGSNAAGWAGAARRGALTRRRGLLVSFVIAQYAN
jgi:hypothetical protein